MIGRIYCTSYPQFLDLNKGLSWGSIVVFVWMFNTMQSPLMVAFLATVGAWRVVNKPWINNWHGKGVGRNI